MFGLPLHVFNCCRGSRQLNVELNLRLIPEQMYMRGTNGQACGEGMGLGWRSGATQKHYWTSIASFFLQMPVAYHAGFVWTFHSSHYLYVTMLMSCSSAFCFSGITRRSFHTESFFPWSECRRLRTLKYKNRHSITTFATVVTLSFLARIATANFLKYQ